MATANGGEPKRWDDVIACDGASTCFFINNAILTRPMTEASAASIVPTLDDYFATAASAGPYLLWSAWPTPDLRRAGYELVGHPPIMLRPVGGERPARPDGLEVREAADAATLADAERVGILGYPLPGVDPDDRGVLYPEASLANGVRVWVGYVDDEPVTTAAAFTTGDVNLVEFVATMAEHRGKGYGAAVTWTATLADPSKPALLEASDFGRPVYERMGYLAISRMTLWLRSRVRSRQR
jgi:hypothetical protein